MDFEVESIEEENSLITIYYFKNGITVTNISKKYDKYGTYEWVNYLENTSDMPSEIISKLWDCDCTMPLEYEENRKWEAYFPNIKTATKIYSPSGSTWTKKEFYTSIDEIGGNRRINHIYPGEIKKYSASGGRSSEQKALFSTYQKTKKDIYLLLAGQDNGMWNSLGIAMILQSNPELRIHLSSLCREKS